MTSVKITRRITLDIPYEYYELEATYDPEEVEGKDIIKGFEKQVKTIRKVTAAKEPKTEEKKPAKKKRAAPEPTEDIKIADLKHGDKVNISVKLVEAIDLKEDIKSFISKADGSAGRYVKFDVTDDSGIMKLTLFGDQVDDIKGVKADAWLTLENAYCKDYKGRLELSIAYGKMEVVYNG